MDKKDPPPSGGRQKPRDADKAAPPPDPNSALGKVMGIYQRVFPPGSQQAKFGPLLLVVALFTVFFLAKCAVSTAGEKIATVNHARAEEKRVRTTGVLVVKANRPEGTVEVTRVIAAGEPAAEAPATDSAKGPLGQALPNLMPGKYTVTARAEGWPDAHGEVEVPAGKQTETTVNFKGGSLRVDTVPSGATVRLGRAVLGKTPLVIPMLPPGPAQLSLEYPSWPIVMLKTTITENVESTETLRLPHGKLTVESQPTGATVLQGKRSLGTTPLVLEHAPAGDMKLTLQAKDFPSLETTVTVVDAGEVKIRPVLGTAFPLLDPAELLAAVWISDEQVRNGTAYNAITGIYRPKNDVVKNLHRERLYNNWLRKMYRISGTVKSYDAASGKVEFAEQKSPQSRYRVLVQTRPGANPGRTLGKDATLAVYGRLTAVEEPSWPGRVITLELSDADFLPEAAP